MFDKYKVKLTLIRDQLGTNPCDPNVLDIHILKRQRKLILQNSEVNKEINKYLDQIPIAKEKGEEEIKKLLDKLEKLMGYEFTKKERELAIAGELDKLKETFKELKLSGTTIFFWDAKKDLPCIGDHMIYGFLKAAAEAIGRTLPKKNGKILHSISYTQSLINQHLKCEEEFITFDKDVKRDENDNSSFLQRSLRAMTAQGPRVTLAKSEIVPKGASLEFTIKVLTGSQIDLKSLKKLFSYGEMVGLGQWRNAGYGQFKFTIKEIK